MSSLITSQIISITPEEAERFLQRNIYPRQRPLRLRQIALLRQAIRAGTFKPGTIELCDFDGKSYLMDGQHRLMAMSQEKKTIRMTLAVFRAETEEELNAHYYRTDNNLKRTHADIYHAAGLAEAWDIPVDTVRRYGAAVAAIEEYMREDPQTPYLGSVSAERRMELMKEWIEHERSFLVAIAPADKALSRLLMLAPVQSIALITFRDQPLRAHEFWSEIARNDGLRKGDPTHSLLSALTLGREQYKARHRDDRWTMRAVSIAWNAFMEGRKIGVLHPVISAPITLSGTSFSRSKVKRRQLGK